MQKTNLTVQRKVDFSFIIKFSLTLIGVTYMVLIAGNTQGLINLNISIINLIIISIISLIWLSKPGQRKLPLQLPLLLWYAAFFVTLVFSIDPRRSLDQVALSLSGLFIFYLTFFLLEKKWDSQIIYNAIIVYGGIFMLLSWLEFGNWYSLWIQSNLGSYVPTLQYRPASANIIALNLNLLLPITFSKFIYPKTHKLIRILLIAYSLSIIALLYMTSSRGGWLGSVAGIAIFIVLLPVIFKQQTQQFIQFFQQKFFLKWVLIFGLIILVMIFAFLFIAQSNHPTHGGIFTSRAPFWLPAWHEFLNDPLSGTGPFTYGSTFIKYNSIPNDVVYAHSHGTIVNILTEMGLLGLGTGLFLFWSVITSLLKALKLPEFKAQIQSLIAMSAISAVAIHSIFDCFHLEPGGLWLLYVIVAIPLSHLQPTTKRFVRPWWLIGLIGLLIFFVWAKTPYYGGVDFANQNNWSKAKQQFEIAITRDPYSALAHQQLALTNSVLQFLGAEENNQAAIGDLESTIRFEPGWAVNYANLAALFEAQGNLQQSQDTALQSVNLAQKMALFQLQLGEIAEKNGDSNTAMEAYLKALSIEQDWATSEFWSATEFRHNALESWISKNPIAQPTTLEEAEIIFHSHNQSRWAFSQLASAYINEGDFNQAERYLNGANLAYTERPIESIETDWLMAEVLFERGDHLAAVSLGEKAINEYHAYGVYGPGSFGQLYYAPRMFRSPAMAMEIVPQMVKPLTSQIWLEREMQLNKWKVDSK